MPARVRRAWSVIRGEARNLLRETVAADSFWDDPELLQYANLALDLRYMQMADVDEGWWTEKIDKNIVANQREYVIDEGVDRVKRVLLVFTEGGRRIEVPLIRNERWSETYVEQGSVATGSVGALPTYRLVGNEVWLEPPPTEARTNGLRLEMEAPPVRLTGDADKLDLRFPAIMETLLVYDIWDIALGVEDAQDLVSQNPVAIGRLSRVHARLTAAWEQFIEKRSLGRVFSQPYYLGD